MPSDSSASCTISAVSRTCVEARAVAGIEIEVQVVGAIDVVAVGVPLIQVDAPEIDDPEQRRQVVDDREVDDALGTVVDLTGANPRAAAATVRAS